MKIVIDGFGGDNTPDEVIKGAVMAAAEYGLTVAITGDVKKLKERFSVLGLSKDNIQLIPANGVIEIEDNPKDILKEKADCSMGKALRMVADGEADAMVSAGSTAALVMGGTLVVRRIKGIKRPSLAPIIPSVKGNYILLDGGANLDCRPEMLQQFAIMGSCYMESVMGIKKPRVGLLNVGTEEEKGRELEHEAYKLIKKTNINFIGNTEAREVPLGAVDVIVTDGFTGNVFLKTVEGMGKFMKMTLKELFYKNIGTKLSALMVKKGLSDVGNKMDYRQTGGSPLLGTAKPVIKAHGSSDALAFKNAIRQAKEFVEKDVIKKIENSLEQINS